MRTSGSQFEIMVNFMLKHGDLSKKSLDVRSTVRKLKQWEYLTHRLNSETSGSIKTIDKWKKVWSDFKNNTKRKAAKIHNKNGRSGLLLTHYERRVLNLMRNQHTPEAINETEIDFVEDNTITQDSDKTSASTPPYQSPPHPLILSSPTTIKIEREIEVQYEDEVPGIALSRDWEKAGPSHLESISSPPISESTVHSVSVISDHCDMPKCRKESYSQSKMSEEPRLTHSEEPHLTHSEEQKSFIKYVIEKGRAEVELEKDRMKLREMELNVQKQWQEVAIKAIDALHKMVDKNICKD